MNDKANNQMRSTWLDSLITMIFSVLVIASSVLITALMSRYCSQIDYEAYLLIRRFIAVIFPFSTLSIGSGLSRYIAKNIEDHKTQAQILAGTYFILALFNALILISIYFVPNHILKDYLFPLTSNPKHLWIATFVWLFGYGSYIMFYANCRGKIQMTRANIINLFFNAVVPVVTLLYLFNSGNFSVFLFLMVWGLFYASGYIFSLGYCFSALRSLKSSIILAWKTVIRYSVPRIPAGILLTVPGYFIPYLLFKSNGDTVFLLNGMLVSQAVFYLADPLGQVFLPRSSHWLESGAKEKISDLLSQFISFSSQFGLIITVQLWIWGELVASLWFGEVYSLGSSEAIRYLSLGIVPAFLFTPLLSVLDGIEKKALITRFLTANVMIVFVIALSFYRFRSFNLQSACFAMILAQFIPMFCLIFALKRRIQFHIEWRSLGESALLASVFGVISAIFASFAKHENVLVNLIYLIIAGILCLTALIIWAYYRKPIWWNSLSNIIKGFKAENK